MFAEIQNIMANPFSATLVEKVITFIVVVVLTALASHLVGKFVRRILRRDEVDIPANSILTNVVKAVIWLAGASFLLSMCFNINVTALVTGLGVVGIAVSLGMQDTLSDFISGVIISLRSVVAKDEYIRVNGMSGKVLDVNWRETSILDVDGNVHIIPNSTISNQEIVHLGEVQAVPVTALFPFFESAEEAEACRQKCIAAATEAASGLAELKKDTVMVFTGVEYAGTSGTVKVFIGWGEADPRVVTSAVMMALAPYTSREAC